MSARTASYWLAVSLILVLRPSGRSEPAAVPGQKNVKQARTDRYGDALPEGAIARLGTVRLRHHRDVWSVVFSPDGKTLVSAGRVHEMEGRWDDKPGPEAKRAIRIWDVASGKPLFQFGGQLGGPGSLALSPDGRILAEGGSSFICLWDLGTRQPIRKLWPEPLVNGNILAITFSQDGKTLASIGNYDGVRLWEVGTGKQLRRFGRGGFALAFSPDGEALCDGSHLWDLATGTRGRAFAARPGGFNSVAFSPDGKVLAVGSADHTVHLYEPGSGTETGVLEGHRGRVNAVAFSPAGKLLATGSEDSTVCLWEVATGKEVRRFLGHLSRVYAVAFSPDGRTLATGGYDHRVKLWDVASGKERLSFA